VQKFAEISLQSIHLLFEEQVERTPENIAVCSDDMELSYRELNNRANQLARYLLEQENIPSSAIGVCTEPTPERLICFLAILKSGCTYVPIDISYANDRIQHMVKTADIKHVLTHGNFALKKFKELGIQTHDIIAALLANNPKDNLNRHIDTSTPLYVIFTSGSTGLPKGVLVPHNALYNHLNWMIKYLGLTEKDSWLQNTNFCFDPSIYELLAPLLCGGRVVFPGAGFHDSQDIVGTIQRHNISCITAVPTFLSLLSETPEFNKCNSLRIIYVGGELFHPALAEKVKMILPRISLYNVYGPTETTINVTAWLFDSQSREHLPIGGAVANTDLYLKKLDEGVDVVSLQRLTPGVSGELCISGASLAIGYVGDPIKTAEKFVNNPLYTEIQEPFYKRLYLTGDFCRVDENSNLIFCGRLDDQVKLNGIRFELGEIETVLSKHSEVQEVSAFLCDNVLAAAIVKSRTDLHDNLTLDLIQYARRYLPEMAVPKQILFIEKMPRQSISNKADKKALKELFIKELKAQRSISRDHVQIAKNTSRNKEKIASILKELLPNSYSEVLPFDRPFADLGLDSIRAQIFCFRIRDAFSCSIRIEQLYEYFTVELLSQLIDKNILPVTENIDNRCVKFSHMESKEPISIIGMACKFSGCATNLENFLNVIRNGQDATTHLPKNRWNVDETALPTPILHGGFLEESPWLFDNDVFAISPKESSYMDPQQRLLLEITYHALENAGIDPSSLQNSKCGVFIGLATQDYARVMSASEDFNGLYGRGSIGSMGAGRISYHFGLEGPSIVIDTACSSSLVAAHYAIESLRQGKCDIAIVGGVSLLLAQDYSLDLWKAEMLAKDGRCKPFSSNADGFARGEGVGVVILKRQTDALKDGNRIYANLIGSALNQDGRSNGITAPSQRAQVKVIQAALLDAGIESNAVCFLETHGTGTQLGDAIETAALAEVFNGRSKPLYIGSVKANIAHCEAAAGIAGLIKAALCTYHKEIPVHRSASSLNEKLPFSEFSGHLPYRTFPWSEEEYIAGLSSFGMSGTNAHVVMQRALQFSYSHSKKKSSTSYHPICLSARTEKSLNELVKRYIDFHITHPHIDLEAVSLKLASNRQCWPHYRAAVVGSTPAEIVEALRKIQSSNRSIKRELKLAFIFTGQGCQYLNMAKQLYETFSLYQEILDACITVVDRILNKKESFLSILFSPETDQREALNNDQESAQLGLFVIEYSLAMLWIELGIKPVIVIGHSLGEYAAACIAEVCTFEDAVKMLAARARAMESACRESNGKMLQINSSKEVIQEFLKNSSVEISVYNASDLIVVSGPSKEIEALQQSIQKEGIDCSILPTQGAFHSRLMNSAAQLFAKDLDKIQPKLNIPQKVIFISSVEGFSNVNNSNFLCSYEYWIKQITSAVNFNAAVEECYTQQVDVCLEIGPHPVLGQLNSQKKAENVNFPHWLATLHRKKNDSKSFLDTLVCLYQHGVLNTSEVITKLYNIETYDSSFNLPLYPFDQTLLRPAYFTKKRPTRTGIELYGASKIDITNINLCADLKLDSQSKENFWMPEHKIHDQVVLPASYFISTGIKTALSIFKEKAISLKSVIFSKPLIFSDHAAVCSIKLELSSLEENIYECKFKDLQNEESEFVTMHLQASTLVEGVSNHPIARIGEEEWYSTHEFYLNYENAGVNYGPAFRRLNRFKKISPHQAIVEIAPPSIEEDGLTNLHPIFIDVCIQTLGICLDTLEKAYMPLTIGAVKIHKILNWNQIIYCQAILKSNSDNLLEGDIRVFDHNDHLLMELIDVACVSAASAELQLKNSIYTVGWTQRDVADLLLPQSGKNVNLLVIHRQSDYAKVLIESLYLLGINSIEIRLTDRNKCEAVSDNLVFFNPNAAHQVDTLCNAQFWKKCSSIDTILYLGNDHLPVSTTSNKQRAEELTRVVLDLQHCLTAIEDKQIADIKNVLLISKAAKTSYESCSAAAMQAITVQFNTEFPRIQFKGIELDNISTESTKKCLQILNTTLDSPSILPTNLWAIKDNNLHQYAISLAAKDKFVAKQFECHPDGYYLITGAFGGVGRHILKHLIEKAKAKKIILIARDAGTITDERKLYAEGLCKTYEVEIRIEAADLEKEGELNNLLSRLMLPLYGIFHLAGTTLDKPISKSSPEDFYKVLSPKLYAAWELHQATKHLPNLHVFALFSSLASIVESPGQIMYATANAGLIHLAEERHRLGLPVTIVHWGPWKDTGMMANLSASPASSTALTRFEGMVASDCCDAFFESLQYSGAPHFAVFKQPVTPEKKRSSCKASTNHIEKDAVNWALILETNGLDKPQIFKGLQYLIAKESGHAASKIDGSCSVDELGLDSIAIIRIRSELQHHLKISIPTALFFQQTTLFSLVEKLADLLQSKKSSHELGMKPTEEGKSDINSTLDHPIAHRPMSYNQYAIWYEQKSVPNNCAYNCSIGWHVCGTELDFASVQKTWQKLLAEHELLRATFDDSSIEPSYFVHSHEEALSMSPVIIKSITDEKDAYAYLQLELNRVKEFSSELSTRIWILVKDKSEAYLIITSHHLIVDAPSILYIGSTLLQSLCNHSNDAAGEAEKIDYDDFVTSQKKLDSTFKSEATKYLIKQLLSTDETLYSLELPTDHPRKATVSSDGASVTLTLQAETNYALTRVPTNKRAVLCLSAWALLLSHYSGQDKILTGIALNGRTQQKWQNTVGHFVNVLPLLIDANANSLAIDFLTSVQNDLFQLLDYQDFPLMMLMEDPRLKKLHKEHGILQTYFNYFDASDLDVESQGKASIKALDIKQQEAQFDVSLWVTQHPHGLSFEIKYRSQLYDQTTISLMGSHYENLLRTLADACIDTTSDQKISLRNIRMLSVIEYSKMLDGTGPIVLETDCSTENNDYVHQMFEKQAIANPNRVAIEFDAQKITYSELNHYANQLADQLLSQGIQREDRVALLFPRFGCPEALISILAIWKCGAAYVPLSIDHPVKRIEYMLEMASCSLVVTKQLKLSKDVNDLIQQKTQIGILDIAVDIDKQNLLVQAIKKKIFQSDSRQEIEAGDRLAYILFTSGSTGNPKGVLVEQKGLMSRLLWMKEFFRFNEHDKFLQSTVLTFDISVPELCLPLICGGSVVLFADGDAVNAHASVCQRHQATMVSTVPSMLGIILEELVACDSLRHVISVGEVLSQSTVESWIKSETKAILHNLYGPTEVTIYATYFSCRTLPQGHSVPIGKPCSGVKCLVLDQYGEPVPIGVPGELYLGGVGVARGYIGVDIKKNAFRDNPYQDIFGGRLYKTGDIVKWNSSGDLEYLGRNDFRVKLHGLLIDLSEIECCMQSFPSVKNAVAMIMNITPQSTPTMQLVGCVTSTNVIVDELEAFLRTQLPKYMVPWKIFTQDLLPENSSGKIDRKRLQSLIINKIQDENVLCLDMEEEEAIQTDVQKRLCELWQEVLQVKRVNLHDNFFHLGGNSLALLRIASLAKQKGLQLPFPPALTIYEQAAQVQISHPGMQIKLSKQDIFKEHDEAFFSFASVQKIKEKTSELIMIHGGDGSIAPFINLSEHLDFPCTGIQYVPNQAASIPELASLYVEKLRQKQPQGPYWIGGHSFGAEVACEMAKVLQHKYLEYVHPVICLDRPYVKDKNKGNYRDELLTLAVAINPETMFSLNDLNNRETEDIEKIVCRWISKTKLHEILRTREHCIDMLNKYEKGSDNSIQSFDFIAGEQISIQNGTLFKSPLNVAALDILSHNSIVIPGNHFSILKEPNVQYIAQHINRMMKIKTNKL